MKIFKACLFLLISACIVLGCKPQHTPLTEPKKQTDIPIAENIQTVEVPVVKKDSAFTVISIDRSKKTIYRGIKNPLTVIVPGAMSTKVEGNGLMKVDNYGHYDIRPGLGT